MSTIAFVNGKLTVIGAKKQDAIADPEDKDMPQEYISMCNAIAKRNTAKGQTADVALKGAKQLAAAIYNKRHPNSPVTRKSDK